MEIIKKYRTLIVYICFILVIGFAALFSYDNFVKFETYTDAGKVRSTIGFHYSSLVFLGVIFLIHRWGRKKLELWLFCLAVSFSLWTIYYVMQKSKKENQLNNFNQELVQLAKGVGTRSTQVYTVEEYGNFSQLLTFIRDSSLSYKNINTELAEACGSLKNTLSPVNLCQQEKILEGKNLVAIFAKKLAVLEGWNREYFSQYDDEIKKVFCENDHLKIENLIEYQKTKKIINELTSEHIAVERQAIQYITDILNFMSEKLGTCKELNGVIYFEKSEDVDVYNQLIKILKDHTIKERAVLERFSLLSQSYYRVQAHT